MAQITSRQRNTTARRLELLYNEEETAPAPWVNLFAPNRTLAEGMALSFIPPTVIEDKHVVELESEEVFHSTTNWENELIVYVVGYKPLYSYMESFVAKNWNHLAKPKIFLHEEGYFIVKFKTEENRDEILYSRP